MYKKLLIILLCCLNSLFALSHSGKDSKEWSLDDLIIEFKNKNGYGSLILYSDSTFGYSYTKYNGSVLEDFEHRLSSGGWRMKGDTVYLTSNKLDSLLPIKVKSGKLCDYAIVSLKLPYLPIGKFGIGIIPYINGKKSDIMFENTDTINFTITQRVETLSFRIYALGFGGGEYNYKTEVLINNQPDDISPRDIDIEITFDEQYSNLKVFNNTKVLLKKKKMYIENDENGNVEEFKMTARKRSYYENFLEKNRR